MAKQISRLLRANRSAASRIVSPSLYTDSPIEEQTLPRYVPEIYYPVSLGDVFGERYEVIAKLGFGSSSTVWLAHDIQRWKWQKRDYFVLKMLTNNFDNRTRDSELETSNCIMTVDPTHEGLRYLRTVENSFEVCGPDGTHQGLIYQPMRENLSTFQRRLSDGRVPGYFLKPLLRMVLTGLDYLHTKCCIIHTDLKPDNILIGFESRATIDHLVLEEESHPSPRKHANDRFIYPSRNFGDLQGPPGKPKIADFGLAVQGNVLKPHNHPIQADLFQAPEVILRAGWTYSADIWNLGAMIWDLLENRTLFEAVDPGTRVYAPDSHLREMIWLLGVPPLELLNRGEKSSQYFTAEGDLLSDQPVKARTSALENSIESLTGEDKTQFLEFVKKMLKWVPEQRATARQLLQDPWLN